MRRSHPRRIPGRSPCDDSDVPRVGLRSDEASPPEYALGKTGRIFPDGTGALIKAGTKIPFNMHYASNGKRTTDRTSVAMYFYPKGRTPKRRSSDSRVGWTRGSRHAARRSQCGHGRLSPPEGQRPHDGVSAPPAQPRETAMPGGNISRAVATRPSLRELGLRLAHRLQLRMTYSRCSPKGPCSTSSRGMTTQRPTNGTPTPTTGWARDGRVTTWRSRTSAGTRSRMRSSVSRSQHVG